MLCFLHVAPISPGLPKMIVTFCRLPRCFLTEAHSQPLNGAGCQGNQPGRNFEFY